MTRRLRTPTAAPGELRVSWGSMDRHNPEPALVYVNGIGTNHLSLNLLHAVFETERPRTNFKQEGKLRTIFDAIVYEPSLLKELEKQGYDLSTLKFSIKKKPS